MWRRVVFLIVVMVFLSSGAVMAAENQTASPFPPGLAVIERPLPADSQKFTFAIVGDRYGGEEAEWPVFDRAIDEINQLRPDFAIMVGDMIPGYTPDEADADKEWAASKQHYERIQVPLVMIPGNHDISVEKSVGWWKRNIGKSYASFDYKGCHFVLLNAQDAWEKSGPRMGKEQLDWLEDDLKKSSGARHTFVFVHIPFWSDPTNTEWPLVEKALGDRPRTIVAGHWHRLVYQQINGADHIVFGATKGAALRGENKAPELGGFPHYGLVTVEGSNAKVSCVEPGAVWSPSVAPAEVQDNARKLFSVDALMPEGLGTNNIKTGMVIKINNGLLDDVAVTIQMRGLADDGWRLVGETLPKTVTVPQHGAQEIVLHFEVPADRLLPVPMYSVTASYKGTEQRGLAGNVPFFPAAAMRSAPDWSVAGRFVVGDVPDDLPADPKTALPWAYKQFGPEKGYTEGDTFEDNGAKISWQPLKTIDSFAPGFLNVGSLYGVAYNSLAYALCGIYSPSDRVVYAQVRFDDMGQVLVNDVMIDNERLFRTRRNPEWVALPLKKGWNTFISKVIDRTGGFSHHILFADPNQELQFAAFPPKE